MPIQNGVGHSPITLIKERDFEGLLAFQMNIVRGVMTQGWPDQEYHYIDTNAGCGRNDDEQCDGSPVIFLKTASRLQMPYRAHFVENDPRNTTDLWSVIVDLPSYNRKLAKVYREDNAKVVPGLVAQLPPNAYGLIYCDPNGIPPFQMLQAAARHARCRYVDILLRCPSSALKRNPDKGKLIDNLRAINKAHWMVQRPLSYDKWQWSFLLGTNWKQFPKWGNKDFWPIDSSEGHAIMDRLNYTTKELEERAQASFFTEPTPNTSSSQSLRP